jgi:chromosomal replication initiation ATPase DnaA
MPKSILNQRQRSRQIISLTLCVMNLFDVSLTDMKGPSRDPALVRARYVYAWVLYYDVGLTLSDIAHMLNRDHSSVLFGINALSQRINGDPELQGQVATAKDSAYINPKED